MDYFSSKTDDCNKPMSTVIDGNNDEVFGKDIDMTSPLPDFLMSFLLRGEAVEVR